ncbi:MAG: hypothetical protein C4298_07900, partial [Thermus sp.]
RPSGTEPLLRVMVEGPQGLIQEVAREIQKEVEALDGAR